MVRNEIDQAREIAALRDRVARLEAAVRARDDFIAIAAHELRNPMQPILGVAELSLAVARKEANHSRKLIQLLGRMQGLIEEFTARASRLLEVTRIEANNLQLEPSRTDMSGLVSLACEKYKPVARRTGSALKCSIASNVIGELDRFAVEHIVDNYSPTL